jgi:hypothetical protein
MSTIINRSQLGILIVGEAHLNDERLQSIESAFVRQLVVKFSRTHEQPMRMGRHLSSTKIW